MNLYSFKMIATLIGLVMLSACDRQRPDESVEALLADPARAKEVARLCREDRRQVSEQTCLNVALAQRTRFKGRGTTRYTPEDAQVVEPNTTATR